MNIGFVNRFLNYFIHVFALRDHNGEEDSLACGRATAVAPIEVREDGFVCIFIPGGNENRGVAAIELAASKAPPEPCI